MPKEIGYPGGKNGSFQKIKPSRKKLKKGNKSFSSQMNKVRKIMNKT